MIKKLSHTLLKGKSYSLLDDILVIPQEALHTVLGRVRKLRLTVVLLASVCAALGIISLAGQAALLRTWHLENENRAKDATIEKLRNENKLLEERLAFQRKSDGLVAKVLKEASWVDHRIIRPAAEKALAHTTDPALYLAIGLVEAELRADVVHPDGVALGMHGLCPKDWHSFLKAKGIMERREDYFDPVKSFRGAEAVLTALVRERGSLEKALLYYNGGEYAAAGMIPASTAYVQRVLHLRRVFADSLNGHAEKL